MPSSAPATAAPAPWNFRSGNAPGGLGRRVHRRKPPGASLPENDAPGLLRPAARYALLLGHAVCFRRPHGAPGPALSRCRATRDPHGASNGRTETRVHSAVHPVTAALRALREPPPDRARMSPAPPSRRGSYLTPASCRYSRWLATQEHPQDHHNRTRARPIGGSLALRVRHTAPAPLPRVLRPSISSAFP